MITCVVPTNRPERMEEFRNQWSDLFTKHGVRLIVVHDGEQPLLEPGIEVSEEAKSLTCRGTDGVRNLGFAAAAKIGDPYVMTLDDDCFPVDDPIQAHLDVLDRKVPLSWMSTTGCDVYPRGMPYGARSEAQVMLSHGVWVGTPDLDAETQLSLKDQVPTSLPFHVGPVPRGSLFPLCGMNVMARMEALPLLYFAPMGPDCGHPDLHRFADIFMGIELKREFDHRSWACWTGSSIVLHSRASDPTVNLERERLGRSWLEGNDPDGFARYSKMHREMRSRWATLIRLIMEGE